MAALIVAAICYGKAGVKELLGRYVQWRIGWGPLTFALLFPAVLTLLAAAVNIAAGTVRPLGSQLAAWPDLMRGRVSQCNTRAFARTLGASDAGNGV